MKMLVCDRCGKAISPYSYPKFSNVTVSGVFLREYELCASCTRGLKEYLYSYDKEKENHESR